MRVLVYVFLIAGSHSSVPLDVSLKTALLHCAEQFGQMQHFARSSAQTSDPGEFSPLIATAVHGNCESPIPVGLMAYSVAVIRWVHTQVQRGIFEKYDGLIRQQMSQLGKNLVQLDLELRTLGDYRASLVERNTVRFATKFQWLMEIPFCIMLVERWKLGELISNRL